MSSLLKTVYASTARVADRLLPRCIRQRTDAEIYSIGKFMGSVAASIAGGSKVLDAGAGCRPYAELFAHTDYESTDFVDRQDVHSFVCDLHRIPKPDNHYDAIVCTQVLEHVEFPQQVIRELYRILKPGGKLFLTAPQGWGIHLAPYHFFNFTSYGLNSLFNHAGFDVRSIDPRGGIFWYLGKRIRSLPLYILLQHRSNPLLFLLLSPLFLLSIPFCTYMIPLVCFYCDALDRKKGFTLGYACICEKQPTTRRVGRGTRPTRRQHPAFGD